MSPPIYTPDGQEVTEIVLPDGSTASQVVGPDGSVVFDAGPEIPDSEDLQARYDFSEEDGSTPVTDQTGNGHDLTGSYSGVGASINGVQAGKFDGTDDSLSTTWGAISEPYHIFVVARVDSLGRQYLLDGGSEYDHSIYPWDPGSEWRIYQGGNSDVADGGTFYNTNPHLLNALFGPGTDYLRIDETDVNNGDTGSSDSTGLTLGMQGGGGFHIDATVGEVLVYSTDKSSIETEVESYLTAKWGPF